MKLNKNINKNLEIMNTLKNEIKSLLKGRTLSELSLENEILAGRVKYLIKKQREFDAKIQVAGKGISFLEEKNAYLVYFPDNPNVLIDEEFAGYYNAAENSFYNILYNKEKGNKIASPQTLLEMWSNFYCSTKRGIDIRKTELCKKEIEYLVRNFKLTELFALKEHVTESEFSDVQNIIKLINNLLQSKNKNHEN